MTPYIVYLSCPRCLPEFVTRAAEPRPEKTAMVARRLISGALGVKVTVSQEAREKERQALKDARGKNAPVLHRACTGLALI